jgi:hypothetical protein
MARTEVWIVDGANPSGHWAWFGGYEGAGDGSPPGGGLPSPGAGANPTVVSTFTTISSGGVEGSPLVLDNFVYQNGLSIMADHVTLRNSTVQRPGSTLPELHIDANHVVVENVYTGGAQSSSDGLRLEGGDSVTLRNVLVDGLTYRSGSQSDAIQVVLARDLTNLLIDQCVFNGYVYGGGVLQETANGSQFDGTDYYIAGTIRDTTFSGGKSTSAQYYNIGGPLYLDNVTHANGYIPDSPAGVVFL